MDTKQSLAQKITALDKALFELHSYISVVKSGTFSGKTLEDGAKLLKFLQDNYKVLQDQHNDLTRKLAEQNKSEEAKEVVESTDE